MLMLYFVAVSDCEQRKSNALKTNVQKKMQGTYGIIKSGKLAKMEIKTKNNPLASKSYEMNAAFLLE